MPTTTTLLAALCLSLRLTNALPRTLLPRETSTPLEPLPKDHAQALEFRFQPLLDFDTDSCYNVPAISPSCTISPGLEPSGDTSPCRAPSALDNSNVYVRGRCNRGWCAFLYSYYFQMDWAAPSPLSQWNHRHDWESIVVWEYRGAARSVAVSCHGEYESRAAEDVPSALSPAEFPLPNWDWLPKDEATHPKVVFHKSGARTHCFRFAKSGGGDEPPENDKHVWIRGGLLGWQGYLVELRDKLRDHDFGSAHLPWHSEEQYTAELVKSMPQAARDDGFDCAYDEVPLFPGIPKPE
ncbi:secreted protein [Plectosphaerella cucumerina]|uniref:Secreted protein n=1 Tax=Plectosphaerella cucumerina TaxID=40658 RepID=A0A8K0WZ75_9PEZI|nr:secreted protein [Plectosphaerella cucumerina]